MPIFRSLYNLEQFETVLQKMAHAVASEAVNTLIHGWVRIEVFGEKFKIVSTNEYTFRFYPKHVFFTSKVREGQGYFEFSVEKKLYLTSNHSTKISYTADGNNQEERLKRVKAFIDKLMADADIKPIPRFSLEKYARSVLGLDN